MNRIDGRPEAHIADCSGQRLVVLAKFGKQRQFLESAFVARFHHLGAHTFDLACRHADLFTLDDKGSDGLIQCLRNLFDFGAQRRRFGF